MTRIDAATYLVLFSALVAGVYFALATATRFSRQPSEAALLLGIYAAAYLVNNTELAWLQQLLALAVILFFIDKLKARFVNGHESS